MPIPNRKEKEDKNHFVSRCMSDDKVSKEFPDNAQRIAVCLSKAVESCSVLEGLEMMYEYNTFGYTEEVNENTLVIPLDHEYYDTEDDNSVEIWDVAISKPGLWENIKKKREREGKKYKPAKRGDPDRPSPEAWKLAQSKTYRYMDPKTGEFFLFDRPGSYKKNDRYLIQANENDSKVKLNKPFRTPNGPKKFSVYVKNDKGNVVKVNFGDPNMEIKRDDPDRRRSYRARHNCDNPGPKWKANYWSCKMWSVTNVSDLT